MSSGEARPHARATQKRAPSYSAKQGQAVYKANRKACVKPLKAAGCERFLTWVVKQIRERKWSFDACCGYAKRHQLFRADEMVCTHTLYNMAWADLLPVKVTELPEAMQALYDQFVEHFADVFKTITVDNGSEFADFAQVEQWGTKVFFAHPYSSCVRAQNKRHNGLFQAFIPKGQSIELYTAKDILAFADELNGRPRKKLGYSTPEELFEAFLGSVYTA
jgi:IS30 family transposase